MIFATLLSDGGCGEVGGKKRCVCGTEFRTKGKNDEETSI